MIKIIKYIFLMIALVSVTWLQAKPVIKATFNQNNTCPDLVAVAVMLEHASTGDEDFKIGSSSIYLNYDTDKLSFFEYVEVNFEEHCYDVSETANSQNGYINISIEDDTANLQFSSSNAAHLVGYLYFNLTAGANLSEGDIYYNEYFTSFNNKMSNDGSDQLTIEFDNSLTLSNETITCPSNDCNGNDQMLVDNIARSWVHVCTVEDGSFTLDWPDGAYYDDLRISINDEPFVLPNSGQSNFTETGLAVGDYDVKVKIGENGCVTTLEDINIVDFSHEVSVEYQQPTCGASDGWIELTWVSKSTLNMQISIDGGLNYTTVTGSDEYVKFDALAEGDYDIQVKWSYWKFACPTNVEIVMLVENCCTGNDQMLVDNIARSWVHVCTVEDGSFTLDWPDGAYYDDLRISINDEPFVLPNSGQSNFTETSLAVGDYDIKVKIGENGCVTTLEDINIVDFSHEVNVEHQQPTCGASDGWIELTWVSKSTLNMQISIDGGLNYTTVTGSEEYVKFDNLAEGDYDIQVKWSYWKFACPTNVEIVTLVENCCTGNDQMLVDNISRSWVHVCTDGDGTFTLDWPDGAYYNDLRVSINDDPFVLPNLGQSNFTETDLAVGDYDIKVKIGENGCVTTLEDINIVDFSHEVTRNWVHPTCGASDGWIELTWVSKSTMNMQISIDGGTSYTTVTGSDEYYKFDDLAVGNYDIWVKWSYAPFACPTQLDDVNLGVNKPTNSGLRADYYCVDNRLRLREVNLPAQLFRFQYRRLTNGSWTGWINTANDTDGIVNINNIPANTVAVKYRVIVRCNGNWSGWGQQKHYNFPSCRLGSGEPDSVLLYPNPANDYINIAFNNSNANQSVIKIYNLAGKLIKEKSIAPDENIISLDTSQLSSGMYLVRIITNGGDEIYADKLTIAH